MDDDAEYERVDDDTLCLENIEVALRNVRTELDAERKHREMEAHEERNAFKGATTDMECLESIISNLEITAERLEKTSTVGVSNSPG